MGTNGSQNRNGTTSTQTISNPTYDVFGNVTANNRPGTAADMTYDYDTLHGWLKGISSPSGFSQQLLRETAPNAQYSGNIGSMLWRNSNGGEQHGYDYTYDELGRLTHAQYSSFTKMVSGCYDESVTYNANSSITSLLRNGMKNDGTYGVIDDLSISYDGNRLVKVTDDAEALNYNGALDFNDGDDSDCEYQYDSNGALTKDSNRGITGITYDYGHHPTKISMSAKKRTHYSYYTADGRKLLSKHDGMIPNGNGGYRRISTTDLYIDGLIVRDGVPLLWQFDGGYVSLNENGTPTSWNYYITDHLGSTRMVVDSNNNVKETINYYPFGSEMRIQEPGQLPQLADAGSHPFRFTGKELDRQNGLNIYDFGARQFDVAGVPMWTSVDPLAEKYYPFTPYSYCAGDPVNKFDPDGREIVLGEDCSPEFIKQYNTAIAYLKEHNAAQIWEQLNSREEKVFVHENAGIANYTSGNNVFWNPLSGLCTEANGEGHRLSPAIRLLHEFGHKLQELTGEYDTADDGTPWQSKEEKRNILEVETPAAIACGEIPQNTISRDSHSGISFMTDSSDSTKITNPNDSNVKIWRACWE